MKRIIRKHFNKYKCTETFSHRSQCSSIIMSISMIEQKRGWYHIFDGQGKKVKTLSDSIGELVGFSSDFFITHKNGWYYLLDETGKKYKTLSDSIGQIVSVTGDTFVAQKNGWSYTFDRFGKKISTRSAR